MTARPAVSVSVAPALPVLACLAGMLAFGSMDAVMKLLSLQIGVLSALFWRCSAALILAAGLFAWRPSPLPPRALLWLHVKRGSITALMAWLFFYGLARTPMAEAVAISFIAPIIALYLAAVMLKERVGRRAITAALLGLMGVVVILAGKLGEASFGAEAQAGFAAILASAALYAWNLVLQRQQAQLASPQEIALFQNIVVLAWLAPFMALFGVVPDGAAVWSTAGLGGVLAVLAILLLSWAYARAEAQVLVPLEYSMFLWGALYGWLLFDEGLGWSLLAGTALIVSGCWMTAQRGGADAAMVEKELPLTPDSV